MISAYSTNIKFKTNANTIVTIISNHGDNNMTNKYLNLYIYPNSDNNIIT